MMAKKKKPKVKTTLHPDGIAGLPGPVVEITPDIDTSRPIILKVDRAGGVVLFTFIEGENTFQIGTPWTVAQQWAETVLATVAGIRGIEAFMFTLGSDSRMIHPRNP